MHNNTHKEKMSDYEVFAEITGHCNLGYVRAKNWEEAVEKAESFYGKNKSNIHIEKRVLGLRIVDFTTNPNTPQKEGREYLE